MAILLNGDSSGWLRKIKKALTYSGGYGEKKNGRKRLELKLT
jgi:hypothetical protein